MSRYFLLLFPTLLFFFSCKMQNGSAQAEHQYTNELVNESSPYLLQHAHNPVNWRPWNQESLDLAKAENKMLLISIGYSACHWCHVMEHESFEDTTVARIMNELFVPIKVDREERPDVDDIYMSACQLASQGSCGWPLNAFALPDGQPVWAGTYFPKKKWMEILEYFGKEWGDNPEQIAEYAKELTEGVSQLDVLPEAEGSVKFSESDLSKMADNLLQRIDFQKGGRSGAPKFPMPANYQFLLENHFHDGNAKSFEAVNTTLREMARGGIYDHLGGGFARYSTDADWLVPHFEKMLYDNGQLVSLYSQAYQVTKDPLYQSIVEETLTFIEREMTSKEGAFYSSLDADSEGEEGKFYVWTQSELDSILGKEDSKVFSKYYQTNKRGNWEHSKNILHRKQSLTDFAAKNKLDENELKALIDRSKQKLFEAREKRIRPGLDDKALTSWNALMLMGYVDAYRAFGKEEYLQTALKNGNFILEKMLREDGGLNRNYKDGKSVINAFLDDYALTINAFTQLYEVTFDESWLNTARELTTYTLKHFAPEEGNLFHYTSDLDPPLITRKTEVSDNVVPGSNSMMATALHRLGLYFYNEEWKEMSKNMMHLLASSTIEQPDFHSNWAQLYVDQLNPPYEVAIVGENAGALRNELISNYLPNAILLGGQDEGGLELLKGKLSEGETRIYVCQNKVCKFPVSEVEDALKLMK